MPFDKVHYLNEMRAMIDKAFARMHIIHPIYEVYTVSIWTDPNAGASSISFDSKMHSDQQNARFNELLQRHQLRLSAVEDQQKSEVFEPLTGHNDNPADFEIPDFEEVQHECIELNWEFDSDGECWDLLEPALQEIGNYAFVQSHLLQKHPEFELAVNGRHDWYESTWPKQ
ncbi:hypothetical protein [Hymenobacter sp. DG01]|uniref:hypothetical protein n=1 Tax=Hymenobacter sp. DG01 TaxID=2584940 RepID=UPI00111CBDB9|nr:hypothetical protein [Hymenobacter sp. DG01]